MAAPFKPIESVLGGLLIGSASGVYMLLARRIAGNSGVLKALVLGPRDAKVLFFVGLVIAGIIMRQADPTLFEAVPADSWSNCYFLWGILIGIGTYLGNGCTSGHGLCGISRLSLRSFVAVPTFMITAIVSSSIDTSVRTGGFRFGAPAPAQLIQSRMVIVCISAVLGLALALVPTLVDHWRTAKAKKQSLLVSLWCGLCAGTGLSIGGMVRPSCVQAALSPQRFDFTLWVLFMSALVTTFIFYRIASRYAGVTEACAAPYKRGDIDGKLVLGSALFGIGWGATGYCPGPLIVALAAQPSSTPSLLTLMGILVGMLIADSAEVKAITAKLFDQRRRSARTSMVEGPQTASGV